MSILYLNFVITGAEVRLVGIRVGRLITWDVVVPRNHSWDKPDKSPRRSHVVS